MAPSPHSPLSRRAESAVGPWVDEAQCKGLDLFYAPPRERPEAREHREELARAVCVTCPAQGPCREHARLHREHGLWGGETEIERAAAGFPASAGTVAPVRRAV